MKKFFSLLLVLSILASVVPAFVEQENTELTTEQIYIRLAGIYNNVLRYLEERQSIWGIASASTANKADQSWFYTNMYLGDGGPERMAGVLLFLHINGYPSVGIAPDEIYNNYFLPIFEAAGKTDNGLAKSLFSFIRMAFYDETIPDQLSVLKTAIKKIKTESPTDENLEGLQNLYKKVSLLVDYTNEASDNYAVTAQRITEFQQEKRILKSEYEFDFDWPGDDTASSHDISEPYKSIIDAHMAAKEEEAKRKDEVAAGTSIAEEDSLESLIALAGTDPAEAYKKAVELYDAGTYTSSKAVFEALGTYIPEDAQKYYSSENYANRCQWHVDFIGKCGTDIKEGSKIKVKSKQLIKNLGGDEGTATGDIGRTGDDNIGLMVQFPKVQVFCSFDYFYNGSMVVTGE